MRTRILFVVNVEWYFLSHRLPLSRALRDRGLDVTVTANVERQQQGKLISEGFRFIPHSIRRGVMSPLDPWKGISELYRLYKAERPDLVHHLTIKPVIYGSIAARMAKLPLVINSIPGLGSMFTRKNVMGWIQQETTLFAYRTALDYPPMRLIVQNPEDREFLIRRRVASPEIVRLIRGSGVNLNAFSPAPDNDGVPIVLLASRLIWDKGIAEMVEATRILKAKGRRFRAVLVGVPDTHSPNAVPASVLDSWNTEGVVEWWGFREDMPSILRQASIVVLPSYREGVPKILIEAAGCGKPLIATDVPGCREVVRHGENGLLVRPRDSHSLAEAASKLLDDSDLRRRMGIRGREIMLQEFSEEVVVTQTLEVYKELLGERW